MNNNLSNFILLILLSSFSFLYLYTSLSIPVDGDGALHAGTVAVMAERGELINYHPFTITDADQYLPIFYPKLFYTEMTVLTTLIGDLVFNIVVPFFGILICLFVYLISRIIFKSTVAALLSTIVVLSSYGLITNSVDMFRMETLVILFAISSVFTLIKYTDTKDRRWLIITIILLGACISTKQQAYTYIPIYILIIFNRLKEKIKIKFLAIFVLLSGSFLIATPLLINEFLTTGTLFYPGVPLVGKVEKSIATIFNIDLYSVGEGWVQYGKGSDRIVLLKQNFSNPINHFVFLQPFSVSNSYLLLLLSSLLLGLGTVWFLIKKQYYLVVFLFLQQILLFVQPLERYFLFNQILAAMIIGGSVSLLKKWTFSKGKIITLLSALSITVYSLISTGNVLTGSLSIPDYSWGSYVPGRIKAEENAGKWLQANSPTDSIIITPRTHVFSYYSRRSALWINQLGGEDIYEAFLNNDIQKIHTVAKSYRHTYFIIPRYWIVNGDAEGRWVSYIEQATVDKIQTYNEYFELVYDEPNIKIYKTR